MLVDGQCECGLEGDYGEEEKGRKIDVHVDGQCECGLEGDMEKRRKEGISTCRWMDNVTVDLREIWRRGERKEDRRAGGWTM